MKSRGSSRKLWKPLGNFGKLWRAVSPGQTLHMCICGTPSHITLGRLNPKPLDGLHKQTACLGLWELWTGSGSILSHLTCKYVSKYKHISVVVIKFAIKKSQNKYFDIFLNCNSVGNCLNGNEHTCRTVA